jgi:hypothetical protein
MTSEARLRDRRAWQGDGWPAGPLRLPGSAGRPSCRSKDLTHSQQNPPLETPGPFTRFEVDGPIAFLTITRPEARNAMTWDMYDALVRACDDVDGRDDLRVFVIRAAGDGAFIAGTDISQFSGFDGPDAALAYERRLDAVIDRLEKVRIPTIARVQGVAAGGGCAIAIACDLRVCGPNARFGVPIARTLGNCLSAANCARLLDLIGPARTKEMIFTAPRCRGSDRGRPRLEGGASGGARRRGTVAGRGAVRTRAAHASRDQGGSTPHPGAAPHRAGTRGRPHHPVLHERRLQGRRGGVSREAAAAVLRSLTPDPSFPIPDPWCLLIPDPRSLIPSRQ